MDDTAVLQLTVGEVTGANLYSYCGNNPVNNVDPTGYFTLVLNTLWTGIAIEVFIFAVIPFLFTAFNYANALKWARFIKWSKSLFDNAIKLLVNAITNGFKQILFFLFGAYGITKSYRLITIALTGILTSVFNTMVFTVGGLIAFLLDYFDNDGLNGTIRYKFN